MIKSDKDDNKFADCAVAGNADYLVSNDLRFDVLEKIDFPEVPLIDAEKFLELIKESY